MFFLAGFHAGHAPEATLGDGRETIRFPALRRPTSIAYAYGEMIAKNLADRYPAIAGLADLDALTWHTHRHPRPTAE
jgi:hypothetical protein